MGYVTGTPWTSMGYLSSYTETDPIFVSSEANNITSTDITNLSNLSGTNTGDQNLSGLIPYTGGTSNVTLSGITARTFGMLRNTTTGTAGQGLTVDAGGAIAGTNNLIGGDLNLSSGISTGLGSSSMHFFTATAGLTGATDNVPTEKMTILGSGNVGIAQTNPLVKLQVGGSMWLVATNPYVRFGTSLSGAPGITGNASSDLTLYSWTGTGTSNGIAFQTGTPRTTQMYLSGSGNLGVGTISPTTNFQVTQTTTGIGTVTVSGNTTVTGTGTQFTNTFKVGDSIIITATGETRAIATITSNTLMTITSATDTVDSDYTLAGGTRFSVLGNGNVGIGNATPSNLLTVGSDLFTVNSSGNVGISGTLNASNNWFKIGGYTMGGLSTANTRMDTGLLSWIGYYPTLGFNEYWNGTTFKYGATGYGFGINANIATGLLTFSSSATGVKDASLSQISAMIINSMGNVNIGSTSSVSNFQVSQGTAGIGTITVTGNTTVTGTGTQFTNTFKIGDSIIITATGETRAIATITSNTLMTIASATNTAGSAYTLAGGDRFAVKGNGNVGIGTTAPVTALDVVGTISVSSNPLFSYASGNGNNQSLDDIWMASKIINLGASFSGRTSISSSLLNGSYNLNITNVDTNGDIILTPGGPSGSVGIGTTSPTNILSLGGTAARTIWMERNTTAATAGQGLTLSSGGAIAGTADLAGGDLTLSSGIATGTGSSAIHFFTSTAQGSTNTTDNTPTEKMTILGNGNVGIGTTSPTKLFQVAGTTSEHYAQIDTGLVFSTVARPTGFTLALAGDGTGNMGVGVYYYIISYVTALGETECANGLGQFLFGGNYGATVTTVSGDTKVNVTLTASSDYRVTGIKVYRTAVNGNYYSDYKLVASLTNTNQVHKDDVADGSRTGVSMYVRENTTNGFIYNNSSKAMFLGAANTFFGLDAGRAVTTGSSNTLIGTRAGQAITSTSGNTIVGYGAGPSMYSGFNTIVGYQAGNATTTGYSNTAMGHNSFVRNTTGNNNVALGQNALWGAQGSNNTAIGVNSFYITYNGAAMSNSVGLGYMAGAYETASNKLFIDSIDRTTEALGRTDSLIYGVFDATPANQILSLGGGGNVGIGTTTPTYNLSFSGDADRTIGLESRTGGIGGALTIKATDTTGTSYNGGDINLKSGVITGGGNNARTSKVNIYSGWSSNSYLTGTFGSSAGVTSYKYLSISDDGVLPISTGFTSSRVLEVGSHSSGTGGGNILLTYRSNNTSGVFNKIISMNQNASGEQRLGEMDFGIDGATNSGYISFFTTNAGVIAEAMRIDKTGNIGIGTTIPESALHVSTNQNAFKSAIFENLNTGVASQMLLQVRSVANVDDSLRFGTLGPNFTTVGSYRQDGGVVSSDINLSGGLALISRHTTGGIITFTTGGHTNEAMRIAVGGNVGIGTTSPTYKLTITTSSNYDGILIKNTTAGNMGKMQVENDIGATGQFGIWGSTYSIVTAFRNNTGFQAKNSIYIYSDSEVQNGGTNSINFMTGGYQPATQTRMVINSSGNVGIGTTGPNTKLEIGSSDLGNGAAGPIITLGRNTNATPGAGSINFINKDGTARYVWQDAAGYLRINTSSPSNANDASGTIIGDQTSTRDTKRDIEDYSDYNSALSMIVNAPLHTFRYVNEVEGYGIESPMAKIRLGFIADEVDPMFMVGNSMDQVSINGLLMASIKGLNLKLEELATPIDEGEESFAERFYTKLISWLGSPDNGLEKICVKKSDGTSFCVNGDQLEQAVNGMSTTGTAPAGNSTPVVEVPPVEAVLPLECVSPQVLMDNVCTDPTPTPDDVATPAEIVAPSDLVIPDIVPPAPTSDQAI